MPISDARRRYTFWLWQKRRKRRNGPQPGDAELREDGSFELRE